MKKLLPFVKKILPLIVAVVLLQLINAPESYAAPPANNGYYYTVRYGDTLFSIARTTGVNPYFIAQVNGLPNPNRIFAGQVLFIPGPSAPSGNGFFYTVQRGDTLFQICRMYGVNPYLIARVNGLSNPNRIYVGQVLFIPGGYYSGYDSYSYSHNYPSYDGRAYAY